jgi:hypothetical protein
VGLNFLNFSPISKLPSYIYISFLSVTLGTNWFNNVIIIKEFVHTLAFSGVRFGVLIGDIFFGDLPDEALTGLR